MSAKSKLSRSKFMAQLARNMAGAPSTRRKLYSPKQGKLRNLGEKSSLAKENKSPISKQQNRAESEIEVIIEGHSESGNAVESVDERDSVGFSGFIEVTPEALRKMERSSEPTEISSSPRAVLVEVNGTKNTITPPKDPLSVVEVLIGESDKEANNRGSKEILALKDGESIEINVPVLTENSLYNFLNNTSDGQLIINYYKTNGKLNDHYRRLLADLIIRTELQTDPNVKIGSGQFLTMAESIHELFPTELVSSYYIGFHKIGPKSCNAKGKLWDKYNNLKRIYRTGGLIAPKNKPSAETEVSSSEDPSVSEVLVADDLEYLSTEIGPWRDILELWTKTSAVRLAKFLRSNQSVSDYVTDYPALSVTAKISDLIDIDFKTKYPNCTVKLHDILPHLNRQVIQLATKKSVEDASFRDSLQVANIDLKVGTGYVGCFLVLALLVPLPPAGRKRKITQVSGTSESSATAENPSTSKASVSIQKPRPSKAEAQLRFICHIKSAGCLKTEIKARVKDLREDGHRNIAFIVIVGKDFQKLEHYVYFNDTVYPTDNIVHSVELCFKLFMVFDAEFPTECLYLWKFIERYIYKLPNQAELPSLLTLAGDLNLLG